jgi:hypothetical protein
MRSPEEAVRLASPSQCEARDMEVRKKVETLIDNMVEQSFPASDPPAWGTVSTRFEQSARPSATGQEYCPVPAPR